MPTPESGGSEHLFVLPEQHWEKRMWGRDKKSTTASATSKPAEPAVAKLAEAVVAKPAEPAVKPAVAKPVKPAVAKPVETQTSSIRYVDRQDCAETFADSVIHVYFDGQSWRIEFGVTWLDELKPNTPITGRRFPAQRMVLTPAAAIELINRMQQVLAQAVVRKPTTANAPTN